jgi:hypothetical protein
MKKTSPRIEDHAAEWYRDHFRSLNGGIEVVGNDFPDFYRHALNEVRGRFSSGELHLMLEAMNGEMVKTGMAGQLLYGRCKRAMELDGLGKKWSVDRTFLEMLESLQHFEVVCLELWATGFWLSGAGIVDGGDVEWCSNLLDEQIEVV